MRRTTIAFALLLFGVGPSEANAWDVYATLALNSYGAKSIVVSTSSPLELHVHQLNVTAQVREEGLLSAERDKLCTRPDSEGLVVQPMECLQTAQDSTLTNGCPYCAEGSSEGRSFVFISLGTEYAVPDCDVWEDIEEE